MGKEGDEEGIIKIISRDTALFNRSTFVGAALSHNWRRRIVEETIAQSYLCNENRHVKEGVPDAHRMAHKSLHSWIITRSN